MAASKPKLDAQPADPVTVIGRDEMNFAELPIALVTDRRSDDQKTLYFEDKNGRLTITGSDAYGLPTAMDADVIVALMYLTKQRNDFTETRVHFSRYELMKLLNWPNEGGSYKRLDLSLNRWTGVLLVYDKCWWNNKLKCYTSAKIHIIENVEIIDSAARRKIQAAGQNDLPLSTFTWDQKFIESCQADNLRQLNLDTYFSLKSAVSKRLYRFLGKRFYVQGDWTFDLKEIAFERVGLSRKYADAYKLKEKLQPAISELESIGFLQPLDPDKRFRRLDRGQWTIRLLRHSPTPITPPPVIEPAPLPPIVAELVSRGVSAKAAADLAERHQEDAITAKIEIFDWLVAKGDKRVAKSPAGYLVSSINDGYASPKGFVSAVEREKREAAKREEKNRVAAARRVEQETAARERAEEQRITNYWKSLTAEQQAELQAAADAQADPDDLAAEGHDFKSFGELIRRKAYIRQLLRQPPPQDA